MGEAHIIEPRDDSEMQVLFMKDQQIMDSFQKSLDREVEICMKCPYQEACIENYINR